MALRNGNRQVFLRLLIPIIVVLTMTLGLVQAQDMEPLGFEEWECPVPQVEGITCGYMSVLEDRNDPDGNIVELAVAIVSPTGADPSPIPVIYLEGGPGGSALFGLDALLDHPVLEDHTVIAFDQRGTGFSSPSLNCYELEEFDEEGDEALVACRDRLAEEIDLQMYNSTASAADVYELAIALGYDQVDLWGVSYGTKLALTVMRDYPEVVRSAVLDSVYALETDDLIVQTDAFLGSLDHLFAQCAEDDICGEAYPALEDDFYFVLDDLNAEPVVLEGDDDSVEVSATSLLEVLFQTLYDTAAIPFLPYAINLMANAESLDDYDEAYRIIANEELPVQSEGAGSDIEPFAESDEVQAYVEEFGGIDDSEGMAYSVDCQEEYQLSDVDAALELAASAPAPINEYLIGSIRGNLQACDIWGVATAPVIEGERVLSDIPTLLVAGAFDPITPISSAESALEGLSNGQLVAFMSGGHGLTFEQAAIGVCTTQLMLDFLADPGAPLDTQCVEESDTIDFYVN